jgi:hypothetical protein
MIAIGTVIGIITTWLSSSIGVTAITTTTNLAVKKARHSFAGLFYLVMPSCSLFEKVSELGKSLSVSISHGSYGRRW